MCADEVNDEDKGQVWGKLDGRTDPFQKVHDFDRLTSLVILDTDLSSLCEKQDRRTDPIH